MKKTTGENKIYNWIFVILAITAVLVNVKNIFTNFNIDAEYAIAMSYRMVRGDAMFSQMWEPHQTSGFLAAAFIWIYTALYQTTTGIAIYLNVVGLLLKVAVAVVLYKTLKKSVDEKVLGLLCLFFATVNPKNMLLPEFSNMQLWFATLLFCTLFRYVQDQRKKLWLVLSAFAICLEVLSYPASVLVLLGVIVVLVVYSRQKWRDIVMVCGICLVVGCVYVGYFVSLLGASEFVEEVKSIITGDGTHSIDLVGKLQNYLAELGHVLMLLAICALLALVITWVVSRFREIDKTKWGLGLFGVCLCTYQFGSTIMVGDLYMYLSIYIAIMAVGAWACKYCNQVEKQIYFLGVSLSLCNLIATLTLTNLTLLTSVAYMVLGVAVSFIPIARACRQLCPMGELHWQYGIILLFCGVTLFRGGFLVRAMQEENTSIIDLAQSGCVVYDGPAMGIVSNYMGPYIMNTSWQEWEQYVNEGDSVLLVGSDKLSVIGYLYEDVEIAADSTICTPTYNEKLLTYWANNPEKYPDVIIVDCWFGELRVGEDTWIMQWIEEEYQPDEVNDGAYWRYYRKYR